MRKLILILFILLSCASVANTGGIISFPGGGGESTVCTIPGSPDIETTTFSEFEVLTSTNAEGQVFDSGTGGNLAKICIYMRDASGEPTSFDLRIGPDINLTTTYMEGWSSGEITGDGWRCFDSVDNDAFTGSTSYYIGAVETGGDAQIGFDDTSVTGTKLYQSSNWTMGAAHGTKDIGFRIYYCD